MDTVLYLFAGVVILVLALVFYFLPVIVASLGHKRNTGAIFVLNLFAGWTLLGWVAALVWACIADAPVPVVVVHSPDA